MTDNIGGDHGGDLQSQGSGYYAYDAIGNLIREGSNNINWTLYGKIRNIQKPEGFLTYSYDPAGNRQSKNYAGITTWYVRDAQGNTMAVYDNAGGTINWREQHLYGSSRIGLWTPNLNVNGTTTATTVWQTAGTKQYELTNHLGNVLATVSDRHATGQNEADVLTMNDYYPFGMLQAGRSYSQGSAYRYGFNDKENDNDVGKGTGNQQDYGMRIYDPRLGRFLSVDPIFKQYPELTPYQFASNTPIQAVDLDGLEAAVQIAPGHNVAQDIRSLESNVHQGVATWVTSVENTYNGTLNAYEFATGRPAGPLRKAQIAFSSLLWHGAGNLTHIDDVSVLKSGKHADGSPANWVDKGVSGFAVFVPLVGGQVFKKGGSALIEGTIKLFEDGNQIEKTAYKVGNYGYKGSKAFREVVAAIRKGGNFVVGSEEEGVRLLKEAFPAIKQDASGAASKFGYRIDREAEEATGGSLKQGHTGDHINYYDKDNKIRGSITIEKTTDK